MGCARCAVGLGHGITLPQFFHVGRGSVCERPGVCLALRGARVVQQPVGAGVLAVSGTLRCHAPADLPGDQVALRTMWECFVAPEAQEVVETVVFNGIVPATNRATGQPEELHLVSAPASRTTFSELVLDQLDPDACLKYLKAVVSPHPYDLEPVEPVIEFQQAKYRFADPVDALADIDSRPDLLKMDWWKFENLIRQLFEPMGLDVRVTQSSRDEGIDAVAHNKTDIVHQAEILIQAKRYSNCVPANDVRALAGSVEEKRATSGVLVTTAWVSAETKAFAVRNNRLRIIEGGELKHLLAEYLNLDVRIDLARRPRRRV